MADTVETLGDAVLTRRLIDRSITEYVDSTVTTVGAHAFQSCVNLESVILENAITINKNAFAYCTKLKKIVLPRVESLDGNGFGNTCESLSTVDFGALKRISGVNIYLFSWTSQEVALIIRTNSVCVVESQTFKIENKNCYIYVPSVLVDSYKTASKWSVYADRIRAIEDYPEVCDPYNWEAVFKIIEAGTYKDVYKIGDLIPLDLGSEGIINMQIIAFDADDLADGSGKAPITWMATVPLATKHIWNPAVVQNDDGSYKEGTGTIGGWGKSELRTYLNDTVKALIPANVRNAIKEVTKNSRSYDTSKNVVETISNDYLWPFSNYELKHIAPSYIEKESTGVTYPSVTEDMLVMPKGYNVWYDYWLRTADWNEKTVYIVQSHYVEFKSNETNSIYNYPHFCFCT